MNIKCPSCGDLLNASVKVIKSPRNKGKEVLDRFPPNWKYRDYGGKGFLYVHNDDPSYIPRLLITDNVKGTLKKNLIKFIQEQKDGE